MTRSALLIIAALLSACAAPTTEVAPAEPVLEAPVMVETSALRKAEDTCLAGDGDGIGGTGCPAE